MKNLRIIILICLSIIVISGNSFASMGNDEKKEERKVSTFNGISLSISANVYITQGSNQEVILEGDTDMLEKIETVVRGNNLYIKTDSWRGWDNYSKVNIYITVAEIENLSVSGSGDIIAQTAIETEEIDITVTGSGSINIDKLSAEYIEGNISGSGDIRLDGNSEINKGSVYITGSGDYESNNLDFKNAKVYITGSGSCEIKVNNELDVTITGSGKVYYEGDPLIDATITGSGRVRSKND